MSIRKESTRKNCCGLLFGGALVALLLSAYEAPPLESARERVNKLVVQIQRADYEGDRVALNRLYQDLTPFADDKKLGAKGRYWRGFAMWRRALNGFNDGAEPAELEQSLKLAVGEFEAALTKDPAFIDAKASAGSCMGLLMFLYDRYRHCHSVLTLEER